MPRKKETKPKEQYYISYKGENGQVNLEALDAAYDTTDENWVKRNTKSAKANSWVDNYGPGNTAVKSPFGRVDYDRLRPDEAKPNHIKEIYVDCMNAYYEGIIRNMVDTMADFAVQGIDIVHRNRTQDKFYKTWFHQVIKAKERSERFLNYLIRIGVVIPYRTIGELSLDDEAKMRLGKAALFLKDKPLVNREIPIGYTFLNPIHVDIINEEITPFLRPDEIRYGMTLPAHLLNDLSDPNFAFINHVPQRILDLVNKNQNIDPLPPDKISIHFYKKDDWQLWPVPLMYSALDDVAMLKKLKLADAAALDAVISQVRIWKLGSLAHELAPSAKALNKLAQALRNNVGGGGIDIVWGPDIELLESKTNAYEFLKNEKYVATLNSIFQAFGFPVSLSATGGSERGLTTNFLSTRTLIQRLQYCRDVLKSFWEQEIRIVQKALGFKYPAEIVFDHVILNDDATEKLVWIHLADRNYISIEALQERFGLIPEIETLRVRREEKMRERKLLPPKAGPFHNPLQEEQLELDKENMELGNKDEPMKGRPSGSKDKNKRKKRVAKPKLNSKSYIHNLQAVIQAQDFIAEEVNTPFLKSVKKDNLRQLTNEETDELEWLKFSLLYHCDLKSVINKEYILKLVDSNLKIPQDVQTLYETMVSQYKQENNEEPKIKTLRYYQASIVALINAQKG